MTHKIPDHIKELRGTLRPSSQRPAAGERLTESPETPDTLSRGAKKEWKSLAPVLVELGTLCRADLRALEQLCETLSTQTTLQAVIEAEGPILKTSVGSYKSNPAMRSLETARNQSKALFTEFGLTPKARVYVTAAPKPTDEDEGGFRMLPRLTAAEVVVIQARQRQRLKDEGEL